MRQSIIVIRNGEGNTVIRDIEFCYAASQTIAMLKLTVLGRRSVQQAKCQAGE